MARAAIAKSITKPNQPKSPGKLKNTKKQQILAMYAMGVADIPELAQLTGSKPSYVASVLQKSGLIHGYFDLYTGSKESMNVYSRFFTGKLGFRDLETAQKSIDLIDQVYHDFEADKDRAGQHHALVMALTMFDRARWCNKPLEAEIFRSWLVDVITPREFARH